MRFNPLSEEEVLNLLPEGEYDFVVQAAEDKVSQKGNDMIKLTLGIWDKKGQEHTVFDYLAMMFKIKHFADATGLESLYQSGGYDASDCLGKSGKCKVLQEEGKGAFPPKNIVKDYIKSDGSHISIPAQNKEPSFDNENDIPF